MSPIDMEHPKRGEVDRWSKNPKTVSTSNMETP